MTALEDLYENYKIPAVIIFIIIIFISAGGIIYYYSNSDENNSQNIKMVSGTEYISNEQGQVIVRMEDSKGIPITNAVCIVTLVYPDKSYFLVDKNMIPTTVPGNYYLSFITPATEGIYEENIRCKIPNSDAVHYISSSFHVSAGLNMIVELSKSQREQHNVILQNIADANADILMSIGNIDNKMTARDQNIYNRMTELEIENSSLKEDIITLNKKIDNMNEDLNNQINENYKNLNKKFKKTAEAMAEIFDEDS